jgi:hypothetical protein
VDRKLQSLLELGHLIGLDLNLDEMLFQIAQKAAEVKGGIDMKKGPSRGA